MRDINRIDKVLDEIKTIWKKHPDLRLGQLIGNVLSDPLLYYVEDDEFITYLKLYYLPKVKKFGDVTKACFTCTKCDFCTAATLDECTFEKRDDVALFKGVD